MPTRMLSIMCKLGHCGTTARPAQNVTHMFKTETPCGGTSKTASKDVAEQNSKRRRVGRGQEIQDGTQTAGRIVTKESYVGADENRMSEPSNVGQQRAYY